VARNLPRRGQAGIAAGIDILGYGCPRPGPLAASYQCQIEDLTATRGEVEFSTKGRYGSAAGGFAASSTTT